MKTQLKRIDGTVIAESDTLTFKELVVENKFNLTYADLTNADLTRADLTRANLTSAKLTRANLTDADLTRANFYYADLTNADLTRANFYYANLTDADLTRANFYYAKLTRANLTDADLTRANLTGADIGFSSWPLWCGTYNVKVDKNIAAQIAMHLCWLNCADEEVKAAQDAVKKLAMRCKHWKERE